METVALLGHYDEIGKKIMREELEKDFHVKEILSEAEYDAKLTDVHYIVIRVLTMPKSVIQQNTQLKLIQRWGVGYDSVDVETASRCGVKVAITSGVNATPVAEYAVLLMLAVYRNLITVHQNVAKGIWTKDKVVERSYTICGKTIGLIGLGAIGKKVAKLVQGFGAEVIYYDLFPIAEKEEIELGVKYVPLDVLLSRADVISLHVPLTDATKNLIDLAAFQKMNPKAIIISTARGGVINEKDLYEALSKQWILGAGLDVFEQEPVPKDHPLLTLPNIVLSSHCGGNTIDNSVHMAYRCVENIRRVSRGEMLLSKDFVNAAAFS